jgi:hypothetical protein
LLSFQAAANEAATLSLSKGCLFLFFISEPEEGQPFDRLRATVNLNASI